MRALACRRSRWRRRCYAQMRRRWQRPVSSRADATEAVKAGRVRYLLGLLVLPGISLEPVRASCRGPKRFWIRRRADRCWRGTCRHTLCGRWGSSRAEQAIESVLTGARWAPYARDTDGTAGIPVWRSDRDWRPKPPRGASARLERLLVPLADRRHWHCIAVCPLYGGRRDLGVQSGLSGVIFRLGAEAGTRVFERSPFAEMGESRGGGRSHLLDLRDSSRRAAWASTVQPCVQPVCWTTRILDSTYPC